MKIKLRLVLCIVLSMIFSTTAYGAQGAQANTNNEILAAALPKFLNAKEIYEKCSPAVFYIETFDMYGHELARGSGFFIDANGRAVTNLHVFEGAFSAKAVLTDGRELPVEGVIGASVGSDLLVFNVQGADFSYLNMGDSSKAAGGEKIYTIGSPLGLSNTISEGIISNPNRIVGDKDYIQISAPISYGSSGGALLNDLGEVIGVTTAGYVNGQNLNFAAPINVVRTIVNESKGTYTMQELVYQMAMVEYHSRAEAFTYVVDEQEPNNMPEQAQYIENGMSVIGTIDQKTQDCFYAACNVPETVSVFCFSIGDGLKDTTLTIFNEESKREEIGNVYELSDGDVGIACDFEVIEPCYVDISLARKLTNPPSKQDIDYIFYYEFTPAALQ